MIPRVIIVGGGFGGLYAARALHEAPVNVTLIDKRNYHSVSPDALPGRDGTVFR